MTPGHASPSAGASAARAAAAAPETPRRLISPSGCGCLFIVIIVLVVGSFYGLYGKVSSTVYGLFHRDPCPGAPIVHPWENPNLAKGRNVFKVLPGESSGCMTLVAPLNKFSGRHEGGTVWVQCAEDGLGIPMAEASDEQGVGSVRLDNSDGEAAACMWYATEDTNE